MSVTTPRPADDFDLCIVESGCYAIAGSGGLCRDHHEEAHPPIPMRALTDWCKAHGIATHDERLAKLRPEYATFSGRKP